jgi:SAM-dependent methyltransferase
MSSETLYATPKVVTDLNECLFYHTMDLPEYGLINGEWDLREKVDEYLGNIDFDGKRVLDVGTASGFLGFHAECMGAEVVAFDSSEDYRLDFIPFAGNNVDQEILQYKDVIKKLNNSYWLVHRAYGSEAKVVYGTVYDIPESIGSVDIAIVGALLEHLRDPFLALQNALKLTKDKVIVVERLFNCQSEEEALEHLELPPSMLFLPAFLEKAANLTWWYLSPSIIKEFIKVLGFETSQITIHPQWSNREGEIWFYTVVGERVN